ncbi:MAG: hypothetical protein B7Z20_01155 [Sphingobium sp. 32-64-5]|nr:MAG: hypothetical protein B7Z20_01155 [Sphingobium sp. 32-64-5]
MQIRLPFADIMEFALALLSLSPAELEALGWTFADRKRLLDHFVRSGKAVQGKPLDEIDEATVTLRLPQRDVMRLQIFARRELPKAASNAAMINRVLAALDGAIDAK